MNPGCSALPVRVRESLTVSDGRLRQLPPLSSIWVCGRLGAKRRPRNKLGFALQLCVLRYPGRLLVPAEFVPPPVVDFIGRQIDLDGDELADYAVRSETRHEHLAELRHLYGFRSFSGGAARELGDRLREEAPQAQSNEDLVRRFVEACRRTRTILPATTTIERLCAQHGYVGAGWGCR